MSVSVPEAVQSLQSQAADHCRTMEQDLAIIEQFIAGHRVSSFSLLPADVLAGAVIDVVERADATGRSVCGFIRSLIPVDSLGTSIEPPVPSPQPAPSVPSSGASPSGGPGGNGGGGAQPTSAPSLPPTMDPELPMGWWAFVADQAGALKDQVVPDNPSLGAQYPDNWTDDSSDAPDRYRNSLAGQSARFATVQADALMFQASLRELQAKILEFWTELVASCFALIGGLGELVNAIRAAVAIVHIVLSGIGVVGAGVGFTKLALTRAPDPPIPSAGTWLRPPS